MMQTIDGGDAAPQPSGKPQLTIEPAAPRKNTTDALVESALDFLSEESKAPANDNAKKPRTDPGEEEAPEAGEDEDNPFDDEPVEGDVDEEPEDGEDQEEAHGRGSREDPYTVKDLPKDKFIEVKVDGEKRVVSLDELANGYIAQSTFSARINKTKALADQAEIAVKQAGEFRDRLRTEFQQFVGDPNELYNFFLATEEREQVLEKVAQRYAALLRRFRDNPDERITWARERDRKRLQAEREHFEAQRRAEIEAKQRHEADQRAIAIFKPGWEEGLKRAGFPKPTQELYHEVMLRVDQRARQGLPIESDHIAEFTERACKLLDLRPATSKRPAPAPRKPASEAKPAARRSRGVDWGSMSSAERRKNPDFWIKDLRPRDYR